MYIICKKKNVEIPKEMSVRKLWKSYYICRLNSVSEFKILTILVNSTHMPILGIFGIKFAEYGQRLEMLLFSRSAVM